MAVNRLFAVTLFTGTRPNGRRLELDRSGLEQLTGELQVVGIKEKARGFSPTRYFDEYDVPPSLSRPKPIHVQAPAVHRANVGVESLSALVLDVDHAAPDRRHLLDLGYLVYGYTTWSHTETDARFRLVVPLAEDVSVRDWPRLWASAAAWICPQYDQSVGDVSRFYFVHSAPSARTWLAETFTLGGRLLEPSDVPLLPEKREPRPTTLIDKPLRPPTVQEMSRGEAMLNVCCLRLARHAPGGRQVYAYGLAHVLGHWVAAGALNYDEVFDALWQAVEVNSLVNERPEETQRAIRTGLRKGMTRAIDFTTIELVEPVPPPDPIIVQPKPPVEPVILPDTEAPV